MRVFQLRVVALGMFIGLISAASLRAAATWQRLETENFLVYSDAPLKEIEAFAVNYAAFRQVFSEFFMKPGGRQPRSTLVLFRRDKEFQQHVPASSGSENRLSAFTTEVDARALLAVTLGNDNEQAMAMVIEFETMWMLRRSYYVPLWAAQGAGEVLAGLKVRKGACEVGDDDGRFSSTLSRENKLPWERFFAITEGSPEYKGDKKGGVFHAQAWAMMNWVLLKDDDTATRFQTLVQRLRTRSPLEALAETMNLPSETAESELRRVRWTKNGFRRLPFNEGAVRAGWQVTSASEAELSLVKADLLLSAKRNAESDQQLARAEALAPDLPSVKEARARRHLQAGEVQDAAQRYREAIAAGALNPKAYLVSASARLDESGTSGADYAGGAGRNAEEALAEIRRALQLDPENAEAYRLLGRAFYVSPKISPACVEELSPGVVIGEKGVPVRIYRGLLNFRLERMEESLADLRAVIADPEVTPPARKQAEVQIERVTFRLQQKQIEEATKARNFAEARALIARALAEGASETRAHDFEALRQGVDAQEFNLLPPKVQSLVEAKRFTEAREAVEQVGRAVAGSAIQRKVEQMRAYVEENSSLAELDKLHREKRWPEAREAARAFLKAYPQSSAARWVRQIEARMNRELDVPANATAHAPGSR